MTLQCFVYTYIKLRKMDLYNNIIIFRGKSVQIIIIIIIYYYDDDYYHLSQAR